MPRTFPSGAAGGAAPTPHAPCFCRPLPVAQSPQLCAGGGEGCFGLQKQLPHAHQTTGWDWPSACAACFTDSKVVQDHLPHTIHTRAKM